MDHGSVDISAFGQFMVALGGLAIEQPPRLPSVDTDMSAPIRSLSRPRSIAPPFRQRTTAAMAA